MQQIVTRILDNAATATDEATVTNVEQSERARQEQRMFADDMRNFNMQHTSHYEEHQRSLGTLSTKFDTILDLQAEQAARQRRDILAWLNPPDYKTHLDVVTRDRVAGTSEWLLQKQAVRQFLDEDSKGILWVHGPPGSVSRRCVVFAGANYADQVSKMWENCIGWLYDREFASKHF